jgi:hypothetical protein
MNIQTNNWISGLWMAWDDDTDDGALDSQWRRIATGLSEAEAVATLLRQLSDQDIDWLAWEVRAGHHAAWAELIAAEDDSRAALNPHQCLDYGKGL